jgi:hypothetical protein
MASVHGVREDAARDGLVNPRHDPTAIDGEQNVEENR